jgi:hypothetical protein
MELDPIPTGAAFADRVRWCVSVARFAPSKHNAQPWRFTVDGGAVELYADATRALRSDPDDRELTIACGAALRAYAVALRALGIEPFVVLLPDGPGGPLARIVEGRPRAATGYELELLRAVPLRHTNRGPLDADAMRPETPFQLQRVAEEEGTVLQLVLSPGVRAASTGS